MILSGPLVFALFKRVFTALNRAAELWNKKFHEFLTKYQLIPSTADMCVYCSFLNNEVLILTIYFNEGLVFYSPESNIMEILGYMDVAFENTRGNVDCYVGLCISQN